MATVNEQLIQHPAAWPVINHLPFEILSMIFTDVMRDAPPDRHYQQLRPLSMACSYWNQVVDRIPELWSVISVNSPRSVIAEQALKKSGNHPLVINMRFTTNGRQSNKTSALNIPDSENVDIREVILNRAPHRWVKANFHIGNVEKDRWLTNVKSALPRATSLQQFRLTQSKPKRQWLPTYQSLLGVSSTSLLYLTTDVVLPSSPAAGLPQLLSLRLVGSIDPVKIKSADWLKLLAACPKLNEMELRSETDIPEARLQQRVSLPFLETVILGCGSMLSAFILGSISIPACKRLDVETAPYQAVALHAVNVARKILEESQHVVDITTRPQCLCIRPSNASDEHDSCLVIHGGLGIPVNLVWTVFRDTGFNTGSITLSLLMDDPSYIQAVEDDPDPHDMTWFRAVANCMAEWPSIRSIRCHMHRVLLEVLLRRLTTASNSGQFPCPALSELIIDRHPWAPELDPLNNALFSHLGSRYHEVEVLQALGWDIDRWDNGAECRSLRYTLQADGALLVEENEHTQPSFAEVLESSRPALVLQPV